MKKRESHIRSIVKGVSWRCIASTTTVLIIFSVGSFFGNIGLAGALAIGGGEFFFKLFVYYIHERVWQNAVGHDGHTERVIRTKTIVWRLIATTATFLMAFGFLGLSSGDTSESHVVSNSSEAAIIAVLDLVMKTILFYLHEKTWQRLPYGRLRAWLRTVARRLRK